MRFTVNGEIPLQHVIGQLRALFKEHKFFTVTINLGKKRTVLQNANLHAWCAQVSNEEKEYTPVYIKALWKLYFGVPICIRDKVLVPWNGEMLEYGVFYDRVLAQLPYELRVEVMQVVPCTSLMNTKQIKEMMEHTQRHYVGRVVLTFGGEDE